MGDAQLLNLQYHANRRKSGGDEQWLNHY
jgi:hypothetical protein